MAVYRPKRNRQSVSKKPDNNQTVEPKKGFWVRALEYGKQALSAVAGAGIGAVVGSVIPGLGTLAGAIIGAIAGRAVVEPIVKTMLNQGEEVAESVIEAPKPQPELVPEEQVTPGTHINNTAEMTSALGGSKLAITLGPQLETSLKNEASPEAPKPGLSAEIANESTNTGPAAAALNRVLSPRLTASPAA